jgi:hypothetical protein
MQNGPPYEEQVEVEGSLTSAVPPKSLTTAHCFARDPLAKVTDLIRSGVKPSQPPNGSVDKILVSRDISR